MKKKIILAVVSAASVLTLAACSSSSSQEIATMKGGKITVEDFYEEAKSQSTSQQIVQNMVIYKVFEEAYGDDVTDKEIQEKYDETADQYGDTFEDTLKTNGLTETSFKAQIKQSLAFEAGLRSHVEVTDDDLKTAWESFHPEVEAQIITTASEEDATAALTEITGGADFGDVAKEVSTDTTTKDDGGTIKFDSQDTDTVPADVQAAAFALEDGAVSEVITVTGQYANTFYLVKMVKNQAKGNSMDPYKDDLTEIATQTQMNDSTFVTSVIQEELKKANVKIKDSAFDEALSQYLTTDSSTAETSSSAATETTEESTEASTEASTVESTEASTTETTTAE
ncbi:peptidylprolyl isomerase [Enterococcus timonensis]|uniref:peptidylprolyl isomerase n=1 Tax=Enterococcus timonensis TaxID=1852364 RepID=UPI0008DA7037|nr:peptidylprolyl isomerase [Enterococcus timonensis]